MGFKYLVFIGAGLLLLLFGWYILKSKRIELLSQYNRKKMYHRDALAEFSGKNFITMGVAVILQSVIFFGISYFWASVFVELFSIAGFAITVTYFSFSVAFGVSKFEI